MRLALLLCLLIFYNPGGCSNDRPAPPSPPLSTSSTTSIPPIVAQPPQMDRIRALTAFTALIRQPAVWAELEAAGRPLGYNTWRVGLETRDWPVTACELFDSPIWDGCPIVQGHEPLTPEWEEQLSRFFDWTARVPELWVQAVPVFTIKGRIRDDGTADAAFMEAVTRRSLELAASYPHVFFSAVNEFRSYSVLTRGQVHSLLRLYPPDRPVSADEPGPPWDFGLRLDLVDYVAFHPARNPEPSRADLRAAVDRYHPRPVFFDETVAFASAQDLVDYPGMVGAGTVALLGRGTEDERLEAVTEHLLNILAAGGLPCFHSLELMVLDPRRIQTIRFPRLQ